MASERTIVIGLLSYLNADKLWTFGQLGDTVEVHDSDLKRVDRINVFDPPVLVAVVDDAADVVVIDEEPEPDPTEGLDLDGLKAYAVEHQVDLGRATSEDGVRAKILEARAAQQAEQS